MPVEAQMQQILDAINAQPPLDTEHLSPLQCAQQMRSAPVNIPPIAHPAARVENRLAPGPGGDIPVRIYWPHGAGPFGVLVNFHGGGWVTGSLDGDEYKSHFVVHEAGCVIVSVDYRLAPEHRFPAAAEDSYAVTRWVHDNARALNIDPTRIGVGGASAGGNLAAVVALMARDRQGPALGLQLLTYPICDDDFDRPSYHEHSEGKVLSRTRTMWLWDQYVPHKAQRANPYAAPMRAHDLRGLPPALITTAECDPLRDEGHAYAERLKAAGVPVEYTCYEGMVHGYVMYAGLPATTATLMQNAAAIKKYLGGGDKP